MPTVHESLLALQTADQEIDRCRARIRALQAELADEGAVTQSRRTHEAARTALDNAQREAAEGEKRLGELTRTIARLEKRLFDGSIHNAREATSSEEELGHRRVERSATEDATLAALERAEEAQAALAAAETALAASEKERAARVHAIKAEGRAETERLKTLQAQRDLLAGSAPPALLARYDSLRRTAPPAVVTVHGGACGVCGVEVPTSMRQHVASDELVQCINCRRLLVEG